ncbi:MAG: carbamoyltransferase C-terminal domain-containing protein [Candidatus Geothermarchaeales archaeon]
MVRGVVTLGINDGHNAGAALVRDGCVEAAVQEERLRNEKNFSGVPESSIKKVFEISAVHPTDVDVVSIVSLNRTYAPLRENPFRVRLFELISPLVHSHTFARLYVKFLHRFRKMRELKRVLEDLGLAQKEVMFVEHHRAHAACAFYQRPWKDDTLVLTLDGAGDGLSSTVNTGSRFDMERVASSTYYDSLGNCLYSEVTAYLGLKRWEHEYKVMGMAPYGRAEYCIDEMRRIIRINPDKPLEFQNTSGKCNTRIQKKLQKLLAGHRFDNIAAACQQHYEDLVTQWVQNAMEETGLHKVACAGGNFLNVKANKVLREMDEVDDIFFYPAADDGGTPVGAALEAYYKFCDREGLKPSRRPLEHLYYGMDYDDEYIERVLRERGWRGKAEYVDGIDEEIGVMVARGKIIARFNGRVEWGPRALGNRSILADPRSLRVIRRLNFAIKHRDFWMPFAPSILENRIQDYLINSKPSYYMIEAFDTTDRGEEIIAALHPYDRTARPQTVNDWNPGYKRALQAFQEETGVGGLLNTSFNLHGYPIVGSPELALWTFENSDLDGVALGNYLIVR